MTKRRMRLKRNQPDLDMSDDQKLQILAGEIRRMEGRTDALIERMDELSCLPDIVFRILFSLHKLNESTMLAMHSNNHTTRQAFEEHLESIANVLTELSPLRDLLMQKYPAIITPIAEELTAGIQGAPLLSDFIRAIQGAEGSGPLQTGAGGQIAALLDDEGEGEDVIGDLDGD